MANKTVEKTEVVKEVKTNNVAEKVDYTVKWKEAKENLLIQLKESLEQIEFHKTRATKIQGVLEVNSQIFEDKEDNDS